MYESELKTQNHLSPVRKRGAARENKIENFEQIDKLMKFSCIFVSIKTVIV
jgi:hypothetical protein